MGVPMFLKFSFRQFINILYDVTIAGPSRFLRMSRPQIFT